MARSLTFPTVSNPRGEDDWAHHELPPTAFDDRKGPSSPGVRRKPSLSSSSVLIKECLEGLEEVKRWVKRATAHREKSTLLLHAAFNVGVAIDHLANSRSLQAAVDNGGPAARTVSRVLVDARRSFDVAATLARIHGQQDQLTKFFMRNASRDKYANATSDLERIADEIWSLEEGGEDGDATLSSRPTVPPQSPSRNDEGGESITGHEEQHTLGRGDWGTARPKLKRTHQRVRRGTDYYSYQSHAVGAIAPVAFNRLWWAGKSLNEVNVVTHQQVKILHASSSIRCMCLDLYDAVVSGAVAAAHGESWNAESGPITMQTGGGKLLWTGHSDGTVRLWNVAARQMALTGLACSRTEILHVVSVGDLEVWVGSATGNIRVLSAQPCQTGQLPHGAKGGSTRPASKTGPLAERIHLVGTVHGLSSTGSTKRAHAGKVRCMCFSRGRVWSGGRDGVLNVWDTATRVRVRSVSCTGSNLGSPVAVSSVSGGLTIASAHKCGTIQLWDAATTNQLFSLARGAVPPSVHALSLCVTDSLLLAGFSDGSLSVWSIHERWSAHNSSGGGGTVINTLPMNLQAHNRPLTCIQEIVCESGEREIVTATTRGTIRMWDYGTLLDAVFSEASSQRDTDSVDDNSGGSNSGCIHSGMELSGHPINAPPTGPKSLAELSSVSVLRDLEGDSEISDLIFFTGLSLGEGDESDEGDIGAARGEEIVGDEAGISDNDSDGRTPSDHHRVGHPVSSFDDSLGSHRGKSPPASLMRQFSSIQRPATPPRPPSFAAQSSSAQLNRFDDLEIPFEEIELRRAVGHGSFGKVFLATWRHIDVAVKELDRNASERRNIKNGEVEGEGEGEENEKDSTAGTAEFVKEMALMQAFRHPNVVLLYGVCTRPPPLRGFMLVQELCGRGSLFGILQGLLKAPNNAGQKSFSWVRRLSMALDAGVGLFYLHEKGVVHRDLKSPNLLVDRYWRLKVGDFGLAKVIAKADATEEARRSSNDINSPRWMAPELLQGSNSMTTSNYGPSADVYSFGHILFEILTLKLPYADLDHSWAVVQAVLDGDRPSLPLFDEMVEIVGGDAFLSKEDYLAYCTLARQCWSADPRERPALTDVLSILRRLLDNTARRQGQ